MGFIGGFALMGFSGLLKGLQWAFGGMGLYNGHNIRALRLYGVRACYNGVVWRLRL
jgi:hypothetical protein